MQINRYMLVHQVYVNQSCVRQLLVAVLINRATLVDSTYANLHPVLEGKVGCAAAQ